ncbi:hypothetical protein MANES_05G078700v8 [Manihot esculenta]|uniref:non-specific serine/threonine protein kinase n=1 Tax=Manihot esculenta TaxID=3983 RepID=A0A2C9VVS2_MANES|nr:hypothetical protein MANES_05G078700v8 [Manihot esculenta]
MEIDSELRDGSCILIKKDAEVFFESNFVGRRSIVKERFSKKYRQPSLDSKLTLKRLNVEARCMTKARRLGVSTPVLFALVEGYSVKGIFLELGLHGVVEERLDNIATQIGDAIGKLHDGGLIHGDLTTSNMLIHNVTNQLVFIDFGLSFISALPEDKAMDRIIAAYKKSSKQWSSMMNKLAQVRQRGRKRTMIG